MSRPGLGLYGGSFDPIHAGHLEPVEALRLRLGLEFVLYVPARLAPHKPRGPSASSYHRFAMAALALADRPALLLSDYEIARAGTTYTYETLRHVRETWPGWEVTLVVGSDSLLDLPQWRESGEILTTTRIATLHREPNGYEACRAGLPAAWAARLAPAGALPVKDPAYSIFWVPNQPVTISSTWIRRAVEEGRDLGDSLPPRVAEYVRRHGLYRRLLPLPRESSTGSTS